MMLQLNPPLPLSTPKGDGYAHLVLDYSQEHHLLWVVFLDSGECWTFENPQVRMQPNATMRPALPRYTCSFEGCGICRDTAGRPV